MSTEADILVQFVRNADDTHGTEAIKFNDDDRPDLEIGKAGYVTRDELHRAAAFGAILEPIDESDLEELGLEVPVREEPEVPLRERPLEELKQLAIDVKADTTGKRSKDDYASAIEAKQAEQPTGVDSLPATATTGALSPGAGGGETAGSGVTTSTTTTGTGGAAS